MVGALPEFAGSASGGTGEGALLALAFELELESCAAETALRSPDAERPRSDNGSPPLSMNDGVDAAITRAPEAHYDEPEEQADDGRYYK